eukprot:CAMPEP_0177632716 /NCGR_PEP_ID=MMETSP0447-20121125/2451_1 /TAXON_ID=0 /ORGANISM="Stygamoeba regulata, Strain BSH-02190019" /LENGTH=548 /DNA_ID=CAMNT_0019134325 /DNA_START=3 /DNA_END=1649 /DNA_ORIENTATION=+
MPLRVKSSEDILATIEERKKLEALEQQIQGNNTSIVNSTRKIMGNYQFKNTASGRDFFVFLFNDSVLMLNKGKGAFKYKYWHLVPIENFRAIDLGDDPVKSMHLIGIEVVGANPFLVSGCADQLEHKLEFMRGFDTLRAQLRVKKNAIPAKKGVNPLETLSEDEKPLSTRTSNNYVKKMSISVVITPQMKADMLTVVDKRLERMKRASGLDSSDVPQEQKGAGQFMHYLDDILRTGSTNSEVAAAAAAVKEGQCWLTCEKKRLAGVRLFGAPQWKCLWVTLSLECLCVYYSIDRRGVNPSSQIAKLYLKEITNVCLAKESTFLNLRDCREEQHEEAVPKEPKDKKAQRLVITHTNKGVRSPLELVCVTRAEMAYWMLALDTLLQARPKTDAVIVLDAPEKSKLLAELHFHAFKGANVKGCDCEWSYQPTGKLLCEVGSLAGVAYTWDGARFSPSNPESEKYGYGVWTGLNLMWFSDVSAPSLPPTHTFVYASQQREFFSKSVVWKFARNFMIRKDGNGEWIIDGEIPDPVVMMLQLLHANVLHLSINF